MTIMGELPRLMASWIPSFMIATLQKARSVSTMMSRTMLDSARSRTKQFCARKRQNSFEVLRRIST